MKSKIVALMLLASAVFSGVAGAAAGGYCHVDMGCKILASSRCQANYIDCKYTARNNLDVIGCQANLASCMAGVDQSCTVCINPW